MGIALIIFLIILLLWPTIMKWVGRFMARRAEDYLRKATGMPPRPGSRQARREEARKESRREARPDRGYYDPSGPIIPKEYAEDVEFVETKDFSETVIAPGEGKKKGSDKTIYRESQVSDVEWEEIRINKRDKD